MAIAEADVDVFAAVQQVTRLAREVAALRKELADLRQQHQRFRISIRGGDATQAKVAGFRAPGGTPYGPVVGLPQLLIDAVGDALSEIRSELEARLLDLESRPFGAAVDFQYDGERTLTARCGKATRMWTLPVLLDAGGYESGKYYSVGDVVSSGGGMWICKEPGFLRKPTVGASAWRAAVRPGRDGRDSRGSKDPTK